MTKAQEALKTIKEIELTHMEYESDENYDGEWEYETVEIYDGTVEDNYHEEIRLLEKELKRLEKIDSLPKTEFYSDNKINLNVAEDAKSKVIEFLKDKPIGVSDLIDITKPEKSHCITIYDVSDEELDLFKGVIGIENDNL